MNSILALMQRLSLIILFILSSCGPGTAQRGNSTPPQDSPPRESENDPPPILTDNLSELTKYLPSQSLRDSSSTQLSHLALEQQIRETGLPNQYKIVPDRFSSEEYISSARVALKECGIEASATIKERMQDCREKNPNEYKWDGQISANGGEGSWRLVVHQQARYLWMDLSTGLIWSDKLSAQNWQSASGYLNENNRFCQAKNDPALGSLSSDEILWRLPTRAEFMQADINGSRFVLPRNDYIYWTASAYNDTQAWAIKQSIGELKIQNKENLLEVRCVGIGLK